MYGNFKGSGVDVEKKGRLLLPCNDQVERRSIYFQFSFSIFVCWVLYMNCTCASRLSTENTPSGKRMCKSQDQSTRHGWLQVCYTR